MTNFVWLTAENDLSDIISLRMSVFCDEQGYPRDKELDNLEDSSLHLSLYSDGLLAGCGRVSHLQDDTFLIGRIALYRQFRGKGLGRVLVCELISKARELGAGKIMVNAQVQAMGFYQTLGFVVCGDEFMDETILHIPMLLE